MRTFKEISQERVLIEYMPSGIGDMYYSADQTGRFIIRKFASEEIANIYMEILYSFNNWINDRKEIRALVEAGLPVEIGTNFVMRPHQIYTSTSQLRDEESDVILPDDFFNNLRLIKAAITGVGDPRKMVIENIIRNTLIEPTGKTYFDFSENKFGVAEPKISPIDMKRWSENSA
ncbi:hypothetical protein F2P44_22675 [Massilia sp. CCM 8695]|uniref:Uncharacterized protein n=1 Tax=Massilia frigida TaxID=2609281 RepID=A0ABX0NJP6_9BURK|nr:hypothetical protein [Massilia frigida]NHZ82060.1 hypothetical protein [Massilia frigida]